MISFWEKESFITYDYLVVGGGITGLSTAASLLEHTPGAKVAVLERGLFPSGASTRNAGFACFGSLTELLADIEQMGAQAAMALVQQRWQGLQQLQQRLGTGPIGYEQQGGYELIAQQQASQLNHIDRVNDLLHGLFGTPVFTEDSSLIGHFGFAPQGLVTVVKNPFEGQLNTGQMMARLLAYVQHRGGQVYTGSEVTAVHDQGHRVALTVADSARGTVSLAAGGVAVCTNAFSQRLLPDVPLAPGRGMVLVTEPLKQLKVRGAFHFDEGYYYFRDVGNRLMFGGGRNLDVAGETTTEFGINAIIRERLHGYLQELILPDANAPVAMEWAGIMAFGADKQPVVRQCSERLVAGVRLGGMGVAIGTGIGEILAEMLLKK